MNRPTAALCLLLLACGCAKQETPKSPTEQLTPVVHGLESALQDFERCVVPGGDGPWLERLTRRVLVESDAKRALAACGEALRARMNALREEAGGLPEFKHFETLTELARVRLQSVRAQWRDACGAYLDLRHELGRLANALSVELSAPLDGEPGCSTEARPTNDAGVMGWMYRSDLGVAMLRPSAEFWEVGLLGREGWAFAPLPSADDRVLGLEPSDERVYLETSARDLVEPRWWAWSGTGGWEPFAAPLSCARERVVTPEGALHALCVSPTEEGASASWLRITPEEPEASTLATFDVPVSRTASGLKTTTYHGWLVLEGRVRLLSIDLADSAVFTLREAALDVPNTLVTKRSWTLDGLLVSPPCEGCGVFFEAHVEGDTLTVLHVGRGSLYAARMSAEGAEISVAPIPEVTPSTSLLLDVVGDTHRALIGGRLYGSDAEHPEWRSLAEIETAPLADSALYVEEGGVATWVATVLEGSGVARLHRCVGGACEPFTVAQSGAERVRFAPRKAPRLLVSLAQPGLSSRAPDALYTLPPSDGGPELVWPESEVKHLYRAQDGRESARREPLRVGGMVVGAPRRGVHAQEGLPGRPGVRSASQGPLDQVRAY